MNITEEERYWLERDFVIELLKQLPLYVFWKNKDSVYLGCNDAFARSLGLASTTDIIGKTDYDLPTTKEESDAYRADDQEVMATRKSKLNIEEYQTLPDGRTIVLLTSKVPLLNKAGEVIGILGIYNDITERKKMELALLEAKESAEAANKAKSEFLALVSHELRIPLTGIIGMARLISSEPLEPELRTQIDDIVYSGEHLQSLINNVLDVAKLEAGKTELHLAPLDLRKLIEEMATMMSYAIKEKGLELLVDYPTGLPHLVFADAIALRQILLNILNNALKFTGKGYIAIKINCIQRTETEATFKIIIKDSGIGIPKNKLDTIFDRFSQVDSSRTRKFGGTGLGLTICKSLVELMNGKLDVESEEFCGTSFILTMPFQLQSLNIELSPWEIYKSTISILIVDDTPRGKVLSKQIASSLCEVINGKEAINTLLARQNSKNHFDIVIIDQQLNSADSIALARTLKQHHHLHQPMLILLTLNGGLAVQKIAKEAGYFDYFVKPTHPTELLIGLTATWEKWQSRKKATTPITQLQNKLDTKSILLVEDDPIVQKVHKTMLEKLGCKVDCSTTGAQALEKISENRYDLIFMDIGLPDITGTEVTKKIRTHRHNVTTPIIGLTGYDTTEDRETCVTVGMNDVAIKPIRPDEIKNILSQWLNTD